MKDAGDRFNGRNMYKGGNPRGIGSSVDYGNSGE